MLNCRALQPLSFCSEASLLCRAHTSCQRLWSQLQGYIKASLFPLHLYSGNTHGSRTRRRGWITVRSAPSQETLSEPAGNDVIWHSARRPVVLRSEQKWFTHRFTSDHAVNAGKLQPQVGRKTQRKLIPALCTRLSLSFIMKEINLQQVFQIWIKIQLFSRFAKWFFGIRFPLKPLYFRPLTTTASTTVC